MASLRVIVKSCERLTPFAVSFTTYRPGGAWGPRVLPELQALMSPRGVGYGDPWAARPDPCPLAPAEHAALRRIAAWMRAEAAELGGSALARRLDGWGVRLTLECGELAA